MHEAYVNICGVPTHVMAWGCWIEESLDHVQEVAICITGNPGLPGFYTEFLGALHNRLDQKIPVWVIGHLGHDDPPGSSLREVPPLNGNEKLFDLDNQVQHKLEFIRKYVPAHVKVHLIGHSIGAWIILQFLQQEDVRVRIRKCYMLFPTIERMAESPNGWTLTKIGLPLYSVFGFLIPLFNRLPVALLSIFIQLYFWFFAIPNYFIGTALKYTKASVVEKVVFLAKEEMARVCSLQQNIVSEYRELLKFYYGTTDGWVPVDYYKQLRERFPDIDAELDAKKIDHSFVLRSSRPMANIVGDMITQNSRLLDGDN